MKDKLPWHIKTDWHCSKLRNNSNTACSSAFAEQDGAELVRSTSKEGVRHTIACASSFWSSTPEGTCRREMQICLRILPLDHEMWVLRPSQLEISFPTRHKAEIMRIGKQDHPRVHSSSIVLPG